MADLLNTLSIVFFILAALFVVLAIVLFFVFKIPSVWSDLTGRSARKSLEAMRQSSGKAGSINYRAKENQGDVVIHKAKAQTPSVQAQTPVNTPDPNATAVLENNATELLTPDSGATELLTPDSGATELLTPDNGATELLTPDSGATELLTPDSGATELLTPDSGATALLTPDEGATGLLVDTPKAAAPFQMIEDIMLIHTTEVI